MHRHVHVRIHVRMHIRLRMRIHVHVRMHINICVHVHTHVHMHMHIQMPVHVHIHLHMHIPHTCTCKNTKTCQRNHITLSTPSSSELANSQHKGLPTQEAQSLRASDSKEKQDMLGAMGPGPELLPPASTPGGKDPKVPVARILKGDSASN